MRTPFRVRALGALGALAAVLLWAAPVSYAQTAAEGTWKLTGSLATARGGHTATVLGGPPCKQTPRPDWCGKILVVGGTTQGDPATINALDPALSSTELYDPKTGTWTSCLREAASPTCPGPLNTARSSHTATLLADGKVLVTGGRGDNTTGGSLDSTELYDPATGTWSSCTRETATPNCPGPMAGGRYDHAASMLTNGKVLAVGGPIFPDVDPEPLAELYDPAAGAWRATGNLNQSRYQHTATLLASGKVLVTGGTLPPCLPFRGCIEVPPTELTEAKFSSELYDPATETWTSCFQGLPTANCPGNLADNRAAHTATLLPNGRVLVAGGADNDQVKASSELYEPLTGTWNVSKLLTDRREGHGATLLPSGKVLVAGGRGPDFGRIVASAELYDPASPGPRWDSAGSMSTARGSSFVQPHSVQTVLISSDPNAFQADSAVCGSNCGKVLVVGGQAGADNNGDPRLASAELYIPAAVVSGVSPASGPLAGGTAVKVTGTGFTHGTSAVLFGGVPAQSFTVDSYGTLTAVSPPRDLPGPVEVTVINEGGRSDRGAAACVTSAACFVYLPELAPGEGGEGPGGGSGGGGPGGGGSGATAPTPGAPGVPGAGSSGQGAGSGLLEVTGFGMDSRAFAPAGKPTPKVAAARRVPRGSRFRYTLSRSAGVTIAIHRAVRGRRVGRRCRRATSPQRAKRRCVRYVRSGSLIRRDRPAGPNVTLFTGRIGGRALRPGRYRATIVASDQAGERSAPRAVTFQILRASRTRKR